MVLPFTVGSWLSGLGPFAEVTPENEEQDSSQPIVTEPIQTASCPNKAALPPRSPSLPPVNISSNALIDHQPRDVMVTYHIYDGSQQLMAPEGEVPREIRPPLVLRRYGESLGNRQVPEASLAIMTLGIENVTDSREKRTILKRKALNHLEQEVYSGGVKRRRLENDTIHFASRDAELGSITKRPQDSPIMERRVRLPKFQPANPVLFRSSINVAVPPGPSHLEIQGDFTEAMSNMAGIPHSVTLSLAHALWNEMASLQLLFPILTMFENSKVSNIALPSNMKYEQILRNALMTIIDELGRVFERTERRAQFRRLEIVVAPSSAHNPDEVKDVEKRFLCAYTTFAPNRELQAPELSNAVLIIDSAPEPLGDIGPETQVVRCPPFALTALAEKVFNRFGHRSHVFGMTCLGTQTVLWMFDRAGSVRSKAFSFATATTPPQPLEEIEGAVQLISFLATLCLMDDSQRGFGTSFFTSSSLLTDLRHFDQLSVPSQTRDHSFAIVDAVVVPQTLYGMGSCVYSARKVTNDTQNLPITDEGDTYTLKVGSHTRPWESTKHLYARAEAAGVKQLAKIEEALFGDLIGDGFRWHAGLDESSYSDLRPRMLAIPGTWIPIWSCGTTWGINNAFKQLIKAHHELYTKAGILLRDISHTSMLLSKDLNGEAAIVGLDQAVSLNDIYDSSSELHHQGEVIPPGDLFFTSFEVNPTHIRKIRPIAFPAIPKLLYRHDLESFLYLIIHTICHLDLERVRWIGTNGPSITAASNLLNLIFDVSGEGARQASIENLRANAVGPRSDLDINMRMPVPQQKLKEMNGCNELSIRVASEKLQSLKEQFIMMSVPAIERSREEYNSGEASPDGRGKPFSRLYDEHRLKLFFGDRMGGDDLHERMLLKLIRSMPNDFGNQVVLPLQDLFRSGYEAKRAWEERVTAQQKERNIEVLLVKKSAANEEAEVANKMLSEVLAKHRCIEEEVFDDETLGGHVTFEKVWEILEDYYPSRY